MKTNHLMKFPLNCALEEFFLLVNHSIALCVSRYHSLCGTSEVSVLMCLWFNSSTKNFLKEKTCDMSDYSFFLLLPKNWMPLKLKLWTCHENGEYCCYQFQFVWLFHSVHKVYWCLLMRFVICYHQINRVAHNKRLWLVINIQWYLQISHFLLACQVIFG